MSLINEALKKAQKQRADEAAAQSGNVPPPGLGGMGAVPPAPPRPPKAPAGGGGFDDGEFSRPDPLIVARTKNNNAGLGRFALPAVILIALIGGGVWWLRSGDDVPASVEVAQQTVTLPEAKPTVAPTPTEPTVEEVEVSMPAPAEPPTIRYAPEPRFTPAPVAVISEEPIAREPAPLPVARQPEPAPMVAFVPPTIPDATPTPPAASNDSAPTERVRDLPARAAAGGLTILSDAEAKTSARVERAPATSSEPSEAVLRFLERSKVTGVRVSATDPKVLMNDRVYRINDVIDRDLQLRVISIDTRELKFRDPQGYIYTKAF